jgi:hypothetical protein
MIPSRGWLIFTLFLGGSLPAAGGSVFAGARIFLATATILKPVVEIYKTQEWLY